MTAGTPDVAQIAEDALDAYVQSGTADDCAVATEAMVRAIRACQDADALEALLDRRPMQDLWRQGLGTLPFWPPVIDAIVSLAEALPDANDAARVLGLARLSCGASGIQILRPDVVPSLAEALRPACLPAFEARAALYRRWQGDGSAERRSAGVHALAWCRTATREDVDRTLARATTEADGTALGSALVTVGVLVRRLGMPADAARALAQERLGHSLPFVRACAAVTLALIGETLSLEATGALTEVVLRPIPLPAGWGWRTGRESPHTSSSLACAALNWASTRAPGDAVRALARVELPHSAGGEALLAGIRAHLGEEHYRDALLAKPQHAGPCEGLIMGALAHLAFEVRGGSTPHYGLVASELDEIQRMGLEAIGRRTPQAPHELRRVGIHATRGDADLVSDFLEGTKPEWRPIPITIGGRERRLHFGALWGVTVFGEVTVSDARDALVATMTPAEAVDLVTRFTTGRMPAYERLKGDDGAGWERDQELALAVIDVAVARGFDLDDMMRAVAANRRSALPAIAALAYLRAHPDHVPAEFREIIDNGVEQTRVAEPLRTLAARWRDENHF